MSKEINVDDVIIKLFKFYKVSTQIELTEETEKTF